MLGLFSFATAIYLKSLFSPGADVTDCFLLSWSPIIKLSFSPPAICYWLSTTDSLCLKTAISVSISYMPFFYSWIIYLYSFIFAKSLYASFSFIISAYLKSFKMAFLYFSASTFTVSKDLIYFKYFSSSFLNYFIFFSNSTIFSYYSTIFILILSSLSNVCFLCNSIDCFYVVWISSFIFSKLSTCLLASSNSTC